MKEPILKWRNFCSNFFPENEPVNNNIKASNIGFVYTAEGLSRRTLYVKSLL
jgi:hypothetical protein